MSKNEMDAMNFDERQRRNWLAANRLTLIVVGFVWLGMIVYDLANHQIPYFLIAMVPIFAIIRLFSYKYYSSRS